MDAGRPQRPATPHEAQHPPRPLPASAPPLPAPTSRLVRVRTEDNTFQHLEVLKHNRTKRHRAREFVVEGVRAINLARAHGWRFASLVYAAGRPLSGWAQELLSHAGADQLIELRPDLMERLSEREETSELLALVRMPPDDLARIAFRPNGLAVVFDRPGNPGNVGAVIRSCDALGADGLILTGHGVDVYDPQAVRGSMGSLFALPVVWQPSHQDVARWVNSLTVPETAEIGSETGGSGRPQIVGGSGEAELSIDQVDLTRPTVLVVGNETRGLSRAYRELCDTIARIPMRASRSDGSAIGADSLNVACAASILLYEADRQRRAAGM
jgi:23S rRNA (uridine2479-2'-O)-methyltransferase